LRSLSDSDFVIAEVQRVLNRKIILAAFLNMCNAAHNIFADRALNDDQAGLKKADERAA